MSVDDTTEYAWYKLHDSGGSMNWAIGIAGDRSVRIRSGMTGHTAKLTEVPVENLSGARAMREILVGEKLKEGYQYAGMAVVKKGRLEPVAAGPAKQPENGPWVLWEIVQPFDRVRLFERMRWAVDRLQHPSLPARVELDEADGVCRVFDQQAWEFGYSDIGGIGPDGRGGGGIHYRQGVVPLLLLTFLQREFPLHVRLADTQNAVLQPVLSSHDSVFGNLHFDPEQVVALGACLELCVSRTRLLSMTVEDQIAAVWI